MSYIPIHWRYWHYPVHRQFGVQHHKVHTAHFYTVVLLEHIAVEVLLQAVMDIRGICEMLKPVHSACPTVGFGGVNLVAAFPVIDFVCAVGAIAHKVESAGNARIGITLLQNNMLTGEALNKFVKRSIELMQ